MFGISATHIILFSIIAVLLYGERLPEVARSFGKSFMEFKKGLNSVRDEFHSTIMKELDSPSVSSSSTKQNSSFQCDEDYDQPSSPKFEPPSGEPQVTAEAEASSNKPSTDNISPQAG